MPQKCQPLYVRPLRYSENIKNELKKILFEACRELLFSPWFMKNVVLDVARTIFFSLSFIIFIPNALFQRIQRYILVIPESNEALDLFREFLELRLLHLQLI